MLSPANKYARPIDVLPTEEHDGRLIDWGNYCCTTSLHFHANCRSLGLRESEEGVEVFMSTYNGSVIRIPLAAFTDPDVYPKAMLVLSSVGDDMHVAYSLAKKEFLYGPNARLTSANTTVYGTQMLGNSAGPMMPGLWSQAVVDGYKKAMGAGGTQWKK